MKANSIISMGILLLSITASIEAEEPNSKDNLPLISSLASAKDENEIKVLLKDKLATWQDRKKFDYSIFIKAIDSAKSLDAQKSIISFLINSYANREGVGIVLSEIITSDRYPIELKKAALTLKTFRYFPSCRESLLAYFEKKENQNSPLFRDFFEMVKHDTNIENNLLFVSKLFDDFAENTQLEIIKSINLDSDGQNESQFIFFRKIANCEKYNIDIRQAATDQLKILEIARAEYQKKHGSDDITSRKVIKNTIQSLSEIISRLESNDKTKTPITDDDIKYINEIWPQIDDLIKHVKTDKQLDEKEVEKAQKEIAALKGRIEKILKTSRSVQKLDSEK